jgi:hypothetical protein
MRRRHRQFVTYLHQERDDFAHSGARLVRPVRRLTGTEY